MKIRKKIYIFFVLFKINTKKLYIIVFFLLVYLKRMNSIDKKNETTLLEGGGKKGRANKGDGKGGKKGVGKKVVGKKVVGNKVVGNKVVGKKVVGKKGGAECVKSGGGVMKVGDETVGGGFLPKFINQKFDSSKIADCLLEKAWEKMNIPDVNGRNSWRSWTETQFTDHYSVKNVRGGSLLFERKDIDTNRLVDKLVFFIKACLDLNEEIFGLRFIKKTLPDTGVQNNKIVVQNNYDDYAITCGTNTVALTRNTANNLYKSLTEKILKHKAISVFEGSSIKSAIGSKLHKVKKQMLLPLIGKSETDKIKDREQKLEQKIVEQQTERQKLIDKDKAIKQFKESLNSNTRLNSNDKNKLKAIVDDIAENYTNYNIDQLQDVEGLTTIIETKFVNDPNPNKGYLSINKIVLDNFKKGAKRDIDSAHGTPGL
jgi:hypothetical protein